MKLLKTTLLVLFAVSLVASLGFAEGEQEQDGEQEEVTLKLSTHHPADVYRSAGSRLIKEEIEEATDGKVKIDIYYSESLAAGGEVLNSVENKVADIGDFNPAYYPDQTPLHAGILVFTKAPATHTQKKEVMQRSYENYPALVEEIEQYNQKILWQYYPTPLNLSSTEPVESIEDFAGLKIRASSEAYLRMLEDLGAEPISMPFTDSYMGLQTGTLDGVFTNIAAMSGQKFYEPAPYSFTSQDMSIWLPFTFTINMDVWNGLTEETQEQINAAMERVDERYAPMYDEEYENQVEIFEEEGEELVFASEEDVETWQNLDLIEELKEELAEKAEDAGIEDGEQFVEDHERYMEEAVE